MPQKSGTVLAIVLLFAGSIAVAASKGEYARLGAWSVSVDSTLGHGCYVHAVYEGGSTLRLGFNMTEQNAYLVLGNTKWDSIEFGKEYPIDIRFSGHERWGANALGFSFEPPASAPYLWIDIAGLTDKMDAFLTEFMGAREVEIFSNGKLIGKLDLTGSSSAGEKLIECQESMVDTGS